MKRLILMRHAKSDWSKPGTTDHKRALNERGIKSAVAMGDWLRKTDLNPDEVLCSDAARTRQTLELLGLSNSSTVFTRDLYLADPDVMARILREQTGNLVLMVAHNPGSALLASELVQYPPDHFDFDRFPTCATLVLAFDISAWSELRAGSGHPKHFIVPHDLTD